jgi:hypothetical protein
MEGAAAGPIVAFAVWVGGCVTNVPATAKAAKLEQLECSDARIGSEDVRWLQEATVLKVEPMILWDTCAGTATVTGTKLLVRRPQGVSRGQLARMFQCASARATLGRVDPFRLPHDPYGFPGAWVDVDVNPEGDNVAVTLHADSVPNNIRLLHRATAFVSEQRGATSR